jgi:hypothetical protein
MAVAFHSNLRTARHGFLTLVFAAGLCGCATTWDDVTSRDFHFRSMWERTDPMTVLHEDTDGDHRAKAMHELKEPKTNGGSDVEQDRVIEVLSQAALSDPQPLVRLAAIQTLGRFSDPRTVQLLIAAYDSAAQLPSEVTAGIQCAAVNALGTTRQQAALAFLLKTAAQPVSTEAVDHEVNAARDIRLTAVRALQSYNGSVEVAAAMAQVLKTERDVAVNDRARETYVKVTGREPPEDNSPLPNQPAPSPGRTDGVKLTGGTTNR